MTAPVDGATVAADVHALADVVVVGSGAGGAVVARELAARGRDVVLVEEGGFFTGKDFTGNPRQMIDLLYRNRGLTGALGRPTILTSVAASADDHDQLGHVLPRPDCARRGAERCGVIASRPMRRFERVEGELNVTRAGRRYRRNSALRARRRRARLRWRPHPAERARLPRHRRVRARLPAGREAAERVRVPPVRGRGLHALPRRPCPRLGRKAIGVVGRFVGADERETGHELRVLARQVVVACGALLTPALLERSGVPDPSRARGRNLHVHPATRLGALFDEEVRGWEEVPQAYNVHHVTREGIFIQGQFVPPAMEAPMLPGVGTAHKDIMARYGRLGSFGALISDESAGRVRAGRGGWPRVTYQLGPADARKLARAIGLTAEIFFAAGAREVYSGVHSRPVLHSIDEARALQGAALRAADFEMMAFHPQGTARMGEDPRSAVTDSFGRVHGTPGLWVGDASLFPSSCKVNPQITIMALATRVAEAVAAT
jgi:choline dehydrogenase-like flavoprotein